MQFLKLKTEDISALKTLFKSCQKDLNVFVIFNQNKNYFLFSCGNVSFSNCETNNNPELNMFVEINYSVFLSMITNIKEDATLMFLHNNLEVVVYEQKTQDIVERFSCIEIISSMLSSKKFKEKLESFISSLKILDVFKHESNYLISALKTASIIAENKIFDKVIFVEISEQLNFVSTNGSIVHIVNSCLYVSSKKATNMQYIQYVESKTLKNLVKFIEGFKVDYVSFILLEESHSAILVETNFGRCTYVIKSFDGKISNFDLIPLIRQNRIEKKTKIFCIYSNFDKQIPTGPLKTKIKCNKTGCFQLSNDNFCVEVKNAKVFENFENTFYSEEIKFALCDAEKHRFKLFNKTNYFAVFNIVKFKNIDEDMVLLEYNTDRLLFSNFKMLGNN